MGPWQRSMLRSFVLAGLASLALFACAGGEDHRSDPGGGGDPSDSGCSGAACAPDLGPARDQGLLPADLGPGPDQGPLPADQGPAPADQGEVADQGPVADLGAGADLALLADLAVLTDAALGRDLAAEPDLSPPGCALAELPAGNFLLAPGLPSTQIHAAAAFDGHGTWVVFNLPEDLANGFDVWALRLGCDGQLVVPPFRVQIQNPGNDTDPAVAVSGDTVCFAWHCDDGGNPNLSLRLRTFDLDGQPRMAEDAALHLLRSGAEPVANVWMPRLAALPGDGFAVAGVWGLPEAERFQAFVQRIGPEGQALPGPGGQAEEAILPLLEPGVTQMDPALATSADGSAHLAWTRAPDEGAERVQHSRLAPGALAFAPAPPVTALPQIEGGGASLSAAPEGPVYLAFHRQGPEMDIVLQDASALAEQAPFLVFGAPNRVDHSPAVQAYAGGGALAWFRTRRGIRNDLIVRRFAYDGEAFSPASDELVVNPEAPSDDHAAAPYAPALVEVGGGVLLVIWSEGVSPDFRLMARFLQP